MIARRREGRAEVRSGTGGCVADSQCAELPVPHSLLVSQVEEVA